MVHGLVALYILEALKRGIFDVQSSSDNGSMQINCFSAIFIVPYRQD